MSKDFNKPSEGNKRTVRTGQNEVQSLPVLHRNTASYAFVCSEGERAQRAHKTLTRIYGGIQPADADIIVALGGDGFMLRALQRYARRGKQIFGMNRGSVGFLLNNYSTKNLPERLANAIQVKLYRLKMTVFTQDGEMFSKRAINEISLFRQTAQTAHIAISVDGNLRLERLICDGVLLATPAGSTAYNLSVHGPILPISSNLLALTPISAFRPRRWPGALLHNISTVRFDILDAHKRPVSASADSEEIRNVVSVEIMCDRRNSLVLLFDPEHSIQERVLKEQFST